MDLTLVMLQPTLKFNCTSTFLICGGTQFIVWLEISMGIKIDEIASLIIWWIDEMTARGNLSSMEN